MKEKLRKCKSFDELREGMLVETRNCRLCGSLRCRVLLIGRAVQSSTGIHGWVMAPNCHHFDRCKYCVTGVNGFRCAGHGLVLPQSVAEGRVYIVITGNDDEAEQAQGKLDESIRDSRRVRYEDVR